MIQAIFANLGEELLVALLPPEQTDQQDTSSI